MKKNIKRILYDSVYQYNILPLTSACNVSCTFCSHKQNPPEVEVYTIQPLTLFEIEELMVFLSADRKIVIGESATRLIEGEPFTHPEFFTILKMLRRRFPQTLLQITTNGSLISEAVAKELKGLEPLEINLSLNSASVMVRSYLMNDPQAETAIEGVKALSAAGVVFHGSMVAMPWLTGWEDIKSTIEFLVQAGSKTIRVFIPGFTRFGKGLTLPPNGWEEELRTFLILYKNSIDVPLTIEPPILNDLRAEITGVIPGSVSQLAGFKPGMEILTINGAVPFSRVDAFNNLNVPGEYKIKVRERDTELYIDIRLHEGEKSGLVMDYDISINTIKLIKKTISIKKANNPVILAGHAGAPLIREALKKSGSKLKEESVFCVNNHYFGGTIGAAGFLVADDFIYAIDSQIFKVAKPDLFILPSLAFDRQGRDLLGISYEKITERFSIDVELV